MVNILITADFCPNNRVIDLIGGEESESIFNDFIPEIRSVDLAITNLECPVTTHPSKTILKIGPSLHTTENAVNLLKQAGFHAVTLANNHIMDYGPEGLEETIKTCDKYDISYVGAGRNYQEASKTLELEIKGKRISIINISENEFSTTKDESYGAHPLDIIKNCRIIAEAKNSGSTVIVIYHGGHEGYSYPSPRLKELFRYYVDVGADAVLCHHAHCYSGFETYKDSPIFYGLGNFVFDWPNTNDSLWNYGYAVKLHISTEVRYEIIPYVQGSYDTPGVRLLDNEERKLFFSNIEEINNVIKDDVLLNREFNLLIEEKQQGYLTNLQPYSSRLLKSLYRRNLLPDILKEKKKLRILNTIRCESHRDLFIKALENELL